MSGRRRRPAGLVPASALLVATAFAAGLGFGRPWSSWLLVVVAVGQGVVAGHHLDGFWRGAAREEIFGSGGRYLAFLAAVGFTAVEAHAVGGGIEAGAPRAAVALLVPPLALGAWALRSAVQLRNVPGHRDEEEPSTEDADGPTEETGRSNQTETDSRREGER